MLDTDTKTPYPRKQITQTYGTRLRIATQFQKLAKDLADSQKLAFSGEPESARDLALKVIPHDDAALQWSLSGGLTASPASELDALVQEAVARHYDSGEDRIRKAAPAA